MANEEHLKIIRQGVEIWDEWRKKYSDVKPNLKGAILYSTNLRGANLSNTDLSDADLNEADLRGADLSDADLSGANLSIASLSYANLRWAKLIFAILHSTNLRGADLSNANLSNANLNSTDLNSADLNNANLDGANLRSANLINTDLSYTKVQRTIFGNVDLRHVKGLEKVKHNGPSTIGIDTLVRSEGVIPEIFLRGAGVPDIIIAYARSLVANPIEYYTCFLSYSSKDEAFAERLHADLQSKGVRCWFAPEDLRIGEKFWHRIDESIRIYDRLMVVLSEHSVTSEWVEREVMAAFEKESKRKMTVLFPIRLDDSIMQLDPMPPWASDIKRQRHIGDFRQWKNHDVYQKAFKRLLRDLQPEKTPKGE
ncbi:toll/interleukin-1 receptor domain-containing protein [Reticulibacter mediterranei]|nr:toll/interleukin-1 receptor domain-containing protein [Reticulibacter mediterranei]